MTSRERRVADQLLQSLPKFRDAAADGLQRRPSRAIGSCACRAALLGARPPSGRAFLLALEQASAQQSYRNPMAQQPMAQQPWPMAILNQRFTVGCLLSQALWTELISCLRLSRGNVDGLPEPLLLLLPPPPKGGWSVPMPLSTESEWLRRWDYPPVPGAAALLLDGDRPPELDRSGCSRRRACASGCGALLALDPTRDLWEVARRNRPLAQPPAIETTPSQEDMGVASAHTSLAARPSQLGVVYLGEMRRRLVAARLIQSIPGFEGSGDSFGI